MHFVDFGGFLLFIFIQLSEQEAGWESQGTLLAELQRTHTHNHTREHTRLHTHMGVRQREKLTQKTPKRRQCNCSQSVRSDTHVGTPPLSACSNRQTHSDVLMHNFMLWSEFFQKKQKTNNKQKNQSTTSHFFDNFLNVTMMMDCIIARPHDVIKSYYTHTQP